MAGSFIAAVLAVALAQTRLTPSPELAEKLQELEAKRAPIEAQRARAFRLRISAGVGFALSAVCLGWSMVEAIAAGRKGAVPLGGAPYRVVVPPEIMLVAGLVLAATSGSLLIAAKMLDTEARHEEEDLADEERNLWAPYERDPDGVIPKPYIIDE
jgi:hypothetical protein